jgi:biopolymer transport protein ExbD
MALVHRRSRSSLVGDEEPDLTPLIDCVFLLLIFFMVTTVFIHTKGLDVDLPAKSETTEQQEKKDINIVIDADGRIQIGGEDVVAAALVGRLKEAMQTANNDNIIIQGHADCAQEHVVLVVDAAKAAEVKGIAFAKEEAF